MYNRHLLEILDYHHSMLADEVRTVGFLRALVHTVRPGDIVLDIGTGTGILPLFACLMGAKHVYAVEQGPVIEVARRVVHDNGFEDRITFLKDWSTNVELPEPADVLVTETLGNIGLEEGILGWVADAKERLLIPGARIIPGSVELLAVPVESEEDYAVVGDWLGDFYAFDFSAVGDVAANNLHPVELSVESFLAKPAPLVRVELAAATNGNAARFKGSASFVVGRDGVMHGIGAWFASELISGITLSNAPPNRTPSWAHAFLPLARPLPVAAGDQLEVGIGAQDNSAHWQWRVTVNGNVLTERGTTQKAHSFEQTTLSGQLSPASDEWTRGHTPTRTEDADVDLFVLRLMDGCASVEEIARQTAVRFPLHLGNLRDAHARVQHLCEYYGCSSSSIAQSVRSKSIQGRCRDG
jgi:protein arginine N-methyltransferase 1